MLISIKSGHTLQDVEGAIHRAFSESRFKIGEIDWKGPTVLNLKMIRLKQSKRYCGNHPNACDIEGGRMGNFLEGADWVEFNDRLNDVLDSLHVSAFVRSDRIVICRKGFERRVVYTSHPLQFNGHDWDYDAYEWNESRFENWCGKIAPPSEYPEGTPGSYERMVASVGI